MSASSIDLLLDTIGYGIEEHLNTEFYNVTGSARIRPQRNVQDNIKIRRYKPRQINGSPYAYNSKIAKTVMHPITIKDCITNMLDQEAKQNRTDRTDEPVHMQFNPQVEESMMKFLKYEELTDILQEYALKLQESRERTFLDDNFDKEAYDIGLQKRFNRRHVAADVITFFGSTIVAGYVAYEMQDNILSQPTALFIGTIAGSAVTVLESWYHVLGRVLSMDIGRSKMIGTTDHEKFLKEKYSRALHDYCAKKNIGVLIPDSTNIKQ